MKNLYIIILFLTLNGCKKSEDGTVEVVPVTPTELKATVISKDQVDLTWKDNSTNETGYKIERKTDSGNFTEIGSTATDISTFSDKTVSLNTNYTYRVYSFNKIGKSIQYSNEVSIKTVNVPTLTTIVITDITSNGAKSGGSVSADGGSAITSRGIVWGISSNPTIASSTKTSDGTGIGSFQSAITGLVASSKYYVRAYAINNVGIGYGNEIAFSAMSVNTVIGANGRIWMDRNLGASRVASSSTDVEAYGDLYQWGRGTDGHQMRTSGTTSTLSTADVPGNNLFIINPISSFDWLSNQNSNLWQGVNGVNNPCPMGFRIPTYDEWDAERKSWSSNNSAGAFASPLKLPLVGHRKNTGLLTDVGTNADYWTSTTVALKAYHLGFGVGIALMSSEFRSYGVCVRCIMD